VKLGKLLFLFAMLIASKAVGQGTFLFTWHGNSNFFQASFQVTMDETLPGSIFNSSLWTNTIQITSLDGLTYRASDQQPAPYIGSHFGPPLSLTFILAIQDLESSLHVAVVPGQGAAIFESSPLPNGHNGEQGFWSYEVIPEPSSVVLLAAGAFLWIRRNLKS
jgi:hypothetical protein